MKYSPSQAGAALFLMILRTSLNILFQDWSQDILTRATSGKMGRFRRGVQVDPRLRQSGKLRGDCQKLIVSSLFRHGFPEEHHRNPLGPQLMVPAEVRCGGVNDVGLIDQQAIEDVRHLNVLFPHGQVGALL